MDVIKNDNLIDKESIVIIGEGIIQPKFKIKENYFVDSNHLLIYHINSILYNMKAF